MGVLGTRINGRLRHSAVCVGLGEPSSKGKFISLTSGLEKEYQNKAQWDYYNEERGTEEAFIPPTTCNLVPL